MPTVNTHKGLAEKILEFSANYSFPCRKEELLDSKNDFPLDESYVIQDYLGYSFDQVRRRGDDMRSGWFEDHLKSMKREAFEYYALAWLLHLLDDPKSDASIMLPYSIIYVLEKFKTGISTSFLNLLAEFSSLILESSCDYTLADEDLHRWKKIQLIAMELMTGRSGSVAGDN